MDFGSLPDGRHLMMVINEYSKYQVVEVLPNPLVGKVLPKLEKLMETYGLLQELETDNGQPFTSKELAYYL